MKFDDIPKEMRAEASERREMLIGMFSLFPVKRFWLLSLDQK